MGIGSTKYLSKIDKNKRNRNAYMVIYINYYYQYIFDARYISKNKLEIQYIFGHSVNF